MSDKKSDNIGCTMDSEVQKAIVQRMNLMDDIFFQKVIEDRGACEEIIQTILSDEYLQIIQAEPQ